MAKNRGGRPTKMTPDVLQKLEDAFSNGLPDAEACLYAGIAPTTLYSYQEKFPKYAERKEALKLTPNIAARKTIVKSLGDARVAQWWLEKKSPDEFGQKSKVELSGSLKTEDVTTNQVVKEAVEKFEETMREVLTKKKV